MFDRKLVFILSIAIAAAILLAAAFKFIQYRIDRRYIEKGKTCVEEDNNGFFIVTNGAIIPDDIPAGKYKIYHGSCTHGIVILESDKGIIKQIYGVNDFFDDFEDGMVITLSSGDKLILTGIKVAIMLKPV